MVVGLAPSPAAQREGRAFAGGSFAGLQRWFTAAGYPYTEQQLRAALYLTSANKCAANPDTPVNRRALWSRCSTYLWKQVEIVQPGLVLLLGSEVVTLLFGPVTRFSRMAGRAYSTKEAFQSELFPPTATPRRWLMLPHPSGLSRIMNDAGVAQRVLASLAQELDRAQFAIATALEAT
jgi:uracil-DNA glycosylase family 4